MKKLLLNGGTFLGESTVRSEALLPVAPPLKSSSVRLH